MKLLGNRIYLEMPKQEEDSKLIVDENTKEALERETLIENTVYLFMYFIPHFLYNTYVICLA